MATTDKHNVPATVPKATAGLRAPITVASHIIELNVDHVLSALAMFCGISQSPLQCPHLKRAMPA